MTENRFSKYVLYAIGEIILVVIGILIALQLNQWNDQRKLRIQERAYLEEITNNLRQDSVKLVESLDFNKRKVVVISNLLGMFSSDLTNWERIGIFAENSEDFTNFVTFDPTKTAYGNMLSAQSIDLIRDAELKRMLSEYYDYDYNEGIQKWLVTMNRMVVDRYWPEFVTKETVKNLLNMEVDFSSVDDMEIHKNSQFMGYFMNSRGMIQMQNELLREAAVRNSALIHELTVYLGN